MSLEDFVFFFVLALIESNMAAKLFQENPPSHKISQFFRRKTEEYMSCTKNATELRDISSFLKAAVGVIEENSLHLVVEIETCRS